MPTQKKITQTHMTDRLNITGMENKYSAPEIKTIEILCEQCIMTGSLGNPGADPDINDWGEF